jgi:hypothetical protein
MRLFPTITTTKPESENLFEGFAAVGSDMCCFIEGLKINLDKHNRDYDRTCGGNPVAQAKKMSGRRGK